ncbi:unnamed protein product, partial [Mesorhabditis belari]|uniref:Uncharacterized protein n=1 Tax=Mesorhabditis belari TaxID=2138241 RepID=A0AAF3FIT8_9BILA
MLKQLLVAFALFSVALTINCYYDWSSGKGESHTGNKMNRPCPGCDYCLKFKTKEKSNTAVYWDCGCSQYNGISGADCLRSGSQKETVYIDVGQGPSLKETVDAWIAMGNRCARKRTSGQIHGYLIKVVPKPKIGVAKGFFAI